MIISRAAKEEFNIFIKVTVANYQTVMSSSSKGYMQTKFF